MEKDSSTYKALVSCHHRTVSQLCPCSCRQDMLVRGYLGAVERFSVVIDFPYFRGNKDGSTRSTTCLSEATWQSCSRLLSDRNVAPLARAAWGASTTEPFHLHAHDPMSSTKGQFLSGKLTAVLHSSAKHRSHVFRLIRSHLPGPDSHNRELIAVILVAQLTDSDLYLY